MRGHTNNSSEQAALRAESYARKFYCRLSANRNFHFTVLFSVVLYFRSHDEKSVGFEERTSVVVGVHSKQFSNITLARTDGHTQGHNEGGK